MTGRVAEGWPVLMMMPGSEPLASLRAEAERFLSGQQAVSTGTRRRLMGALAEEGLLAVAERLAERLPEVCLPAGRMLLLVDQFEEVFTQCAAEKRDEFVQSLVSVGKAQTPLSVVMTMRSDFINEWLETGQPSGVMDDDSVHLGALQGENLRAAIVEPARMQGYEIEPALLNLLLGDVKA